MRLLIFHGYLLRGTGSNVYNANLAAALVRAGHRVDLFSQERDAAELDFVDAVGTWEGGSLRLEVLREPVRCTVFRPDIGPLLPVYVADRYAGIEARPLVACDDAEVARYVAANVAAVREVAARAAPDGALANHLVLGPAILARALPDTPRAVKIHGSALEYAVRPQPERFLPWAREGLATARTVLVGSRHSAERLWEMLADPGLPARTRLGPPGVDIERFTPRDPAAARAGLLALAARVRAAAPAPPTSAAGSSFALDAGAAAAALARVDPRADRLVAFVGKLIVSKGVDLLLAAWPLVLAAEPAAKLVVVGFGAYRDGLERLLAALDAGDLDAATAIAAAGRELEGGPRAPLPMLAAFLGELEGARRSAYVAAARGMTRRVVFTGRLEHGELVDLLPAAEIGVVPSTFPESFGMVAIETAACGALPICAAHSGLGEVARTLAAVVEPDVARMLAFPLDDHPIEGLAERIVAALGMTPAARERASVAIVDEVRRRWSWEGVARDVLAACDGRLDELAPVA